MNKFDQYLEAHLDDSLAELSRYCAQPSVAAQNWGIEACADLTAEMLRARGFDVKIYPTAGSPVVVGERKGKVDKTLVFYNHYDVQPAEPMELWDSHPFEPALRDGKLFARGVSDDKGHLTSRLFAIDAILAEEGELPCNIKFVVEGEEEIGSVHFPEFVKTHREALVADVCIWEFGGVNYQERPEMVLGMRGICYVELSVETASDDVHSGLGGSVFPNAAWRLVWALNTLKGTDERIRIPGFYDAIVPPGERELALLAELPEYADEWKERYGVKSFVKGLEDGVELRRAAVYDPTCTICGLTSGYQGPGSKTVLPAKASAKVDFRLVPEQRPDEIVRLLRAHLDEQGFPDVQINFLGGTNPAVTDPDHPFIQLVIEEAEAVYGTPVEISPIIGGSGPNYAFKEYLGVPIATAGVGYPGSRAHAPNENMRVDLYLLGARHIVRILKAYGA